MSQFIIKLMSVFIFNGIFSGFNTTLLNVLSHFHCFVFMYLWFLAFVVFHTLKSYVYLHVTHLYVSFESKKMHAKPHDQSVPVVSLVRIHILHVLPSLLRPNSRYLASLNHRTHRILLSWTIRYQEAIDKYDSVMKTEPNVLYYTNLAKERICYCLVKVRDGPHPPLLTVNFYLSVINNTDYLILVDYIPFDLN